MKTQNTFKQGIETKYLNPSDTQGARMKATCLAGSIIIGFDHALSLAENHAKVAQHLVEKLGWHETERTCDLVGGQLKSANYAWIFVDQRTLIKMGYES